MLVRRQSSDRSSRTQASNCVTHRIPVAVYLPNLKNFALWLAPTLRPPGYFRSQEGGSCPGPVGLLAVILSNFLFFGLPAHGESVNSSIFHRLLTSGGLRDVVSRSPLNLRVELGGRVNAPHWGLNLNRAVNLPHSSPYMYLWSKRDARI